MKKVLSLLAVFLLISHISIGAKEFAITVNDVQMEAGGNSEIVVSLVNSSEWASNDGLCNLEMGFNLPEGITFTGDIVSDLDGFYFDEWDSDNNRFSLIWGSASSMYYGYSLAPEGVLCRLPITIESNVTSSLQGSVKNIKATISHNNGGMYTSGWDPSSSYNEEVTLDDILINFYLMTPQTLALTTLPDMTYGDGSYALPQTTTEGLPLEWTVSDATIASVSNYQLNILKAGTATVTATQAGQAQYLPFTRQFTLSIGKAALNITPNDCSREYGAANPAFTASYTGFANGDNSSVLTTQPTISTTATTSSAVGTYPISASGAAAANYNISYGTGTLTITKAQQSMALQQIPAMTYGDAAYTLPTATAEGNALTWTVANSDIATVSDGKLTIKKVGTTTVTATQAGNTNYTSFSKTFTVNVAKATLTITPNNSSKVYGSENPTLSVSFAGFVNGDNTSVLTTQPSVSTTATASSAVGTYPITATGAAAANYNITYGTGTLTVNKAALTITADDYSRYVGFNNPVFTVSYSGFVNSDDETVLTKQPVVTTQATAESPVGTYPITVSGAEAANYSFNYVAGTLTVKSVEVTDITALANAIYLEPTTGFLGADSKLNIKLKNVNNVTSYGFELVLPEGMSIEVNGNGEFDDAVELSSRHSNHTITTNKLSNNTYKMGIASLSSKSLTGNDGAVLTITVHVSESMKTGTYPIVIQNPLIVNSDGTKPAVQETTTAITIEDYTKGDVDNDGVIDLADAVLIINYYVGKDVPGSFKAKAADVDGDDVIDLADAVLIINYYVGKIESLSRKADFDMHEPQ